MFFLSRKENKTTVVYYYTTELSVAFITSYQQAEDLNCGLSTIFDVSRIGFKRSFETHPVILHS